MKRNIAFVLLIALLLVPTLGSCAEKHNYGEWIEESAPSCTQPGVKGHYYCADCDTFFDAEKNPVSVEDLVIPAAGHVWNNGEVSVEATCVSTGTKLYTCTVCDKTKTEDIAINPAGHTYGEWIPAVAANCGTGGTLGHYHCADCGKNFDADKNELATIDTEPASGNHIPTGDWIIDKDSTCYSVGSKHRVCSICGQPAETEEIPLEAHTYGDLIEATDPNCGYAGTVAHYHCEVCGKDFAATEDKEELETIYDSTRPAVGEHTYGDLIPAVPAGNNSEGTVAHYHCDICGKDFDADKNELDSIYEQGGWSICV